MPLLLRWNTEPSAIMPTSLAGQEQPFAVVGGREALPFDFGLEWDAPAEINVLSVRYAALLDEVYQPAVDGQRLEYWDRNVWKACASEVSVDYTAARQWAPVLGCGYVEWIYRFEPLQTTRLRVVVTGLDPVGAWHGHCAVRQVAASREDRATPLEAGCGRKPQVRVFGQGPADSGDRSEGALNLVSDRFGAEVSLGETSSVRWAHPVMFNRLVLTLTDNAPVGDAPLPAPKWWDGTQWRPIQSFEAARKGRIVHYTVPPLAVTGVRVSLGEVLRLEAFLDDAAAKYFQDIEASHADRLQQRLANGEPDYAAVSRLLLPLRYCKTAIGRPGDRIETLVIWNGTLLMVENDDQVGWLVDRPYAAPVTADGATPDPEQLVDRWFAFACGPDQEVFGSRPAALAREYADGYLPAVTTCYGRDGLEFVERAFVTAPGEDPYGVVVEVTIVNRSNREAATELAVILGRRISARAGTLFRSAKPPTPLTYGPLPTGYRCDADGRTVRNAAGEIVLHAAQAGQWGGTPWENYLRFPVAILAGKSMRLQLFLPHVLAPERDTKRLATPDLADAFPRFRAFWERELSQGLELQLPEERLNRLYKSLLAQLSIVFRDEDRLKYGAYWYECFYGVEEGWPLMALAQYGLAEESRRCAAIMVSDATLSKARYLHQFRNGTIPWYVAEVSRLVGDRSFVEPLVPRLIACAEWTLRQRRATGGSSAPAAGLLPKHTYGGDISTPAIGLYANAVCWRGLLETGMLMRDLGRGDLASRYLAEAADYRETILSVCDRILDRSVHPPFLPLALDIGEPGQPGYQSKEARHDFLPATELGNYWNLFAPLFLATGIFAGDEGRSRWLTDYIEQRGGTLCGLTRFMRGLDHIYGLGYAECLLERREREKFLALFYGLLAHGMARDIYSGPETAYVFPLRTSNLALENALLDTRWRWGIFGGPYMNCDAGQGGESEPLSASAGMVLLLLRRMLVAEEKDADLRPTGRLVLANLIPRRWLEQGQQLTVRRAPTCYGDVSFRVASNAADGYITAEIDPPQHSCAREIVLRLPHPDRIPIRQVLCNGREWLDHGVEEIRLPGSEGRLAVRAGYA